MGKFTEKYKRAFSFGGRRAYYIILANDDRINTYWKGGSGSVVQLTFLSPSPGRDIYVCPGSVTTPKAITRQTFLA